jgi:hypothetical protein
MVWPGDANYDGTVDNLDVLELGLAFSSTGPARNPGGNNYVGQQASNWTGTVSTGWNKAHADCNGDGVVGFGDTLAIFNNYFLNHAFRVSEPSGANDIVLVPQHSLVAQGTWNEIWVYVGDAVSAMQNVYGLAFDITFDANKIAPGDIYLTYDPSFLNAGAGNVQFRKSDQVAGMVHAATVRTDGSQVTGSGRIATLHFRPKGALNDNVILNFAIITPSKMNAAGGLTPITGVATSVITDQTASVKEVSSFSDLAVYPNPARHVFNISAKAGRQYAFEICDVSGRTVEAGTFSGSTQLRIEDAGVYVLKVTGEDGASVKRLICD